MENTNTIIQCGDVYMEEWVEEPPPCRHDQDVYMEECVEETPPCRHDRDVYMEDWEEEIPTCSADLGFLTETFQNLTVANQAGASLRKLKEFSPV